MKDEIKEILDFKEEADYKKLSVDEIVTLENYITNLEQKNKELILKKLIYKQRIIDVIAICNSYKKIIPILEDIENILQGSDNNE